MDIQGSIALVTGANRGLGSALVKGLLAAGAKRVYAGTRNPGWEGIPGAISLVLDVTKPGDIAAAVRAAPDVNLVINNAGIFRGTSLLDPGAGQVIRENLETNLFGLWGVTQAFAPVIKANGGGTLVQVLSVLSWMTNPGSGGYSASKAAGWALTNGFRQELEPRGINVVGVHLAWMDTDMAKGYAGPKASPEKVTEQILAAVTEGRTEVLADAMTRSVKASLARAS